MPLVGCSDAPSVPVFRFGLELCDFSLLRSDCGATWQPAVQLSEGFFQGALLGAGEPACSPGQTALAPAAPPWSVLPFSSPEVSPPPGL